jgi:hypothetical protein
MQKNRFGKSKVSYEKKTNTVTEVQGLRIANQQSYDWRLVRKLHTNTLQPLWRSHQTGISV